eukprot:Gb_15218 [translate_table: standard]
MNALKYFKAHLKYKKNRKIKEVITQIFIEYRRRGKGDLRNLDTKGDAAVTKPKSKPRNKGDGEDQEQTKLRPTLNSMIIHEKPNASWSDVERLESSKQVL